ncbi:L,D-transpeptidase family protein [Desulfovibrio gilichinskyi]|uniref:Murein L,D-transpeptidase YafK n=1 Tax=Desulfovibrio gilichinskyi TaxID=1519643 RepID=A0A1X7DGX4_9BACT|nr:L,D-transpeptidase family protein [Desulfovibrio gilichinskyi]SMF15068.1 Murein L,D-transpeptidase YafK [Desulfovibrio gilichinskyi]
MTYFLRILFVSIIVYASLLSNCFAGGWAPVVESTSLIPGLIVAVDKGNQKLHLLVHKSPLHVEATLTCATGKTAGDKEFEGDKRTPEGVYFTKNKRTDLDDFELYGDMAFPLDFPNPVDRINGKTGYGIWIHGRGKQLVAMDTQGCIALNNSDINFIDSKIHPGTPVLIGESVSWENATGTQVAESVELKSLVNKWAADWSNKDAGFFNAYSDKLFSKSEGRSFKFFKDRKKKIFSKTSWIDVSVFNLNALPGPDYWVTWFDQYYRSGRLSSSTAKRLYWQKINGTWKIVGREYGPAGRSFTDEYLESKKESVLAFLDKWRLLWLSADLEQYSKMYDSNARQGKMSGIGNIKEYKKSVWKERTPSVIEFSKIKLIEHPDGLEVDFDQSYSDVSGYSDFGRKKLVIRPVNGEWRIVDEQWSGS